MFFADRGTPSNPIWVPAKIFAVTKKSVREQKMKYLEANLQRPIIKRGLYFVGRLVVVKSFVSHTSEISQR